MIKSGQLELFETILLDIFKLKKKPTVVYSRQIRFNNSDCYGLYCKIDTKKSYQHKIRVSRKYIKNPEQLFGVLAHEYVHAWQIENDKELDHGILGGFMNWTLYFLKHYDIDIVYVE